MHKQHENQFLKEGFNSWFQQWVKKEYDTPGQFDAYIEGYLRGIATQIRTSPKA